jgi:3-methyladenine DNA glycosylase AlkD
MATPTIPWPGMQELVAFVQAELSWRADPDRAGPMAAYMKTEMPFYGVTTPARVPIEREVKRLFAPEDADDYRANVLALWGLSHREEKYVAIGYARAFPELIVFEMVDLYRQLIVEGAWWDLVDPVATGLVGRLVRRDRARMRPLLRQWIDGDDLWLRRTALICQLGHKEETDIEMLFDFCRRRAHETEFFIRKAIGWALRDFSKTNPRAVADFLSEQGKRLSGLSRREASKYV